jgi:ACS family hexuronate transporter-like MFS transporter
LASRRGHKWSVLALLFFSITINLFDRQVLSLVAPLLRDQFHLSNTQYSYIVFSFLLGLTLSQMPAGWLMDRRGPRLGMAFIMTWWSAANALHALASSVASFSVFRFLLGVGESGNYSAGVKVISQWFEPRLRALAGGIFNTGSVVGALLAPPLVIYLATRYSWQVAFLVPSLLGVVWVGPWLAVYRGAPEPASSPTGTSQPTFASLLGQRAVWGAMLARALSGPVNHFYWYWLPEYLRRERGFSLEQIGAWAGLPYLFGAMGNVAGGWFSSHLMARGWTALRARAAAWILGLVFCLSSMAVPLMPGGHLALGLICLASFGIATCAATWIGAVTDVFPQPVVARVTGIAGLGEGVANMVLTLATGRVVDMYSYLPVFLVAGLLPALGVGSFFLLIRKRPDR